MQYPAAIILVRNNDVEVFPIIVEALSKQEAHGKAHEIGMKIKLEHFKDYDLHIKAGISGITTFENATFIEKTHA